MSIDEFLVSQAAVTLALTAIGLVVRQRAAFCWSFLIYVLGTCILLGVETSLPALFREYAAYSTKETALAILKLLVGLEIGYRSFSSFPRARIRLGVTLLIVLCLTAAAGQAVPRGLYPYDAIVGILHPRQQAGTLALYAIIVSTASWYRVPLHPLYRAILVGFCAYLAVGAIAASYSGLHPSSTTVYVVANRLQLGTYSATVVWWAWAAWRPVRPPTPVIARLQPWARSW
jgi:hypothetical protein